MDEKVANALDFIRENVDKYGRDNMIALTSFGKDSLVLMNLIRTLYQNFKFVWIKPPFLPQETNDLADFLIRLWNLNLDIIEGVAVNNKEFMENIVLKPKMWKTNAEACCQIFKVEPIVRYVREHNVEAWFAGLRNTESEKRNLYPPVRQQGNFTKLHPILDWKEWEIWRYIACHYIPIHPYYCNGYRSLGCDHCSKPSSSHEPERAGRWYGTTLAAGECGIHCIPPLGTEEDIQKALNNRDAPP